MNLFVGVVVAIISGAIQSLGLTLQRKSHLLDQGLEEGSSKSWALWRLGVILFVCANLVGSSIQLLALPLVVLCPLQAVGLVFNSVYATILLGEPFTQLSAIGTALVCLGAGIVAGLGAVSEPKRTLDELLAQLRIKELEIWLFFTLCVALLLYYQQNRQPVFRRGVFFGVISGILSSHSLLFAKSAVEMLVLIFHQPSILLRVSFWIVVAVFLSIAVLQLAAGNAGLKYTPTSVLYPLTFCVFNVVSMCNSLLYYRQSGIGWSKVVWVLLGTAVLVCGVVCLSSRYDMPSTPELNPLVEGSHYTSFEALSPNISNPDSPTTSQFRRSLPPRRNLSKEQSELVRELTNVR